MQIIDKYTKTEYTIWYGGREIEGQNKWAISTDDDRFYDYTDGLWRTRKEAYQAVVDYIALLEEERYEAAAHNAFYANEN